MVRQVGLGWSGAARSGSVGTGVAGKVGCGVFLMVEAGLGLAGQVGFGLVESDVDWLGRVGNGRYGWDRQGKVGMR